MPILFLNKERSTPKFVWPVLSQVIFGFYKNELELTKPGEETPVPPP